MKGIGASSGKAIGRIKHLQKEAFNFEEMSQISIALEYERYEDALVKAEAAIEAIALKTKEAVGVKEAEIFDAHIEILKDPELMSMVRERIGSGKTAEYSVLLASNQLEALFRGLEDSYMSERASDIRDVGKQVLRAFLGESTEPITSEWDKVILVAHDFTPSDMATMDIASVCGLLAEIGGTTSHSSIMAQSMCLPAVVGVGESLNNIEEDTLVIIDGSTGEIIPNPSEEILAAACQSIEENLNKRKKLEIWKSRKGRTADDRRIEIACNIGTPEEAESARLEGAEGIGLFRTEFLYMNHDQWPSEEVQYKAYKEALEALEGAPVIIRTLDIGGDKHLAYYALPEEMNPFLGHRAIRLCLEKKDIFKTQLRALLRASAYGKLKIMFPMISTMEELSAAKDLLNVAKMELKAEQIPFDTGVEVGMMIEIPAAAAMADVFAAHVDFFSIGTNDLTQYMMACDRMNPNVAHLYSHLQPAVIRMIKQVGDCAMKAGIMVGMCGEAAGDTLLQPFLIGAGLTELSMSTGSVLKSKENIGKFDYQACKKLADKLVKLTSKHEIENALQVFGEGV